MARTLLLTLIATLVTVGASVSPVVLSAQARSSAQPNAQQATPTVLKITDAQGNVITLALIDANTTIDYTSYGFMYRTDNEYGGVRIRQGEGTVAVKWDRLSKIDISKVSEAGGEGKMTTASGTAQPVVLIPWSKQGLKGKTELGEFFIALDKVRTIEVVR